MISTTSEHSLRAMACITSRTGHTPSEDDTFVLRSDISVEAGVPFNYLSKILGVLVKAGMLHASRGRGGGYRLAKPADQIPLIEVIELFEGIKARPDCLLWGERSCSDYNSCTAHESFKKVRQAYIEFLETTTIADIAGLTHVDGTPADQVPS